MSTEYIHGEVGITALYGKETTPGTEAATILVQLGLVQDITGIELGYEEKKTTSITSQQILKTTSVRGNYQFTVTFFVTDWRFLFAAFGAYLASYPQTNGVTTHILIMSNRLPSYTFELINDDRGISRKVLGCKFQTGRVLFVEGEEIKVEMTFVGRSTEKDATPQTATESTVAPWFYDHVTITEINSVEKVDRALEVTWIINRNTEARRTIGSKEPRFIKEGMREHQLDVELYSDDLEIYDIVKGFTEFATSIKAVKSAAADEITIAFAKGNIAMRSADLPGDDVVKERFTINPYNTYGTQVCVPTVIDGIADYDP